MADANNDAFLDEDEGVIELVDEEGNTARFEFIDSVEYNGAVDYALVPETDDEEAADEFVVLKEREIDGDSMLVTVDDDEEYSAVGEVFLNRFSELAGYEDDDDSAGDILQ